MGIILFLLLLAVAIVVFIVAGIVMLIKAKKGDAIAFGTCVLLFTGAIGLSYVFGVGFIAFDAGNKILVAFADVLDEAVENSEEKILERIEENADEITFYLDGNEVEYESIDLDLYEYTYDEKKQKVYMTK